MVSSDVTRVTVTVELVLYYLFEDSCHGKGFHTRSSRPLLEHKSWYILQRLNAQIPLSPMLSTPWNIHVDVGVKRLTVKRICLIL